MKLTKAEFEQFSSTAVQSLVSSLRDVLSQNADVMWRTIVGLAMSFERGGRLLVCGNGGSAADAQHFAGELVATFQVGMKRRALPVLALSNDSATMTALANDFGYEHVFSRQVEAFGSAGDHLLAISTSGSSTNVLHAVKVAREREMGVISISGVNGKELQSLSDLPIIVPSTDTQVIQNTYQFLLHLLCYGIEQSV